MASDTEFSLWNNVITAVTAVGATGTAPVGAIDLYATLLELAGGVSQSSESKSFVDCFANPTTCDARYDQTEIESPDANAIIARDRMTTEITRLIAARWATHANSMIGVTMTGVSTR